MFYRVRSVPPRRWMTTTVLHVGPQLPVPLDVALVVLGVGLLVFLAVVYDMYRYV